MIKGLGKIYTVGHHRMPPIFNYNCEVTEKIDGSQFSFGSIGGFFHMRSKNRTLHMGDDEILFNGAMQTAFQLYCNGHLVDGATYRAEVISRAKHNTICYGWAPREGMVLFGVNDSQWDVVKTEADRLGLECVPLIHSGRISPGDLDNFLKAKPLLGGKKIEGVVISCYPSKWKESAKYVSPEFRETTKTRKSSKKPIGVRIAERFSGEARWEKAVQHMEEDGILTGTPKDIGEIIDRVHLDTWDECLDDIKYYLTDEFYVQINSALARGIPQWYKKKIGM